GRGGSRGELDDPLVALAIVLSEVSGRRLPARHLCEHRQRLIRVGVSLSPLRSELDREPVPGAWPQAVEGALYAVLDVVGGGLPEGGPCAGTDSTELEVLAEPPLDQHPRRSHVGPPVRRGHDVVAAALSDHRRALDAADLSR